ncbi:hypothetical protein [Streptomyces aidingensis]|uniref:Uncharacterized protein n=1 Tax=Streptomyces aidingensis TaxID=910347 RepID=A0A1I1EZA8_9ACTN|nr:hypothetical protein [Streptomyces aidingensis]SFB92056.1 hypothetical protein SAMN05421773_101525 [Streptomyces aidingensis]
MAALLWLLIPLTGAVLAGVWSAWATRRHSGTKGVNDSAGVRGYEAFRAAMERRETSPGMRGAARADG